LTVKLIFYIVFSRKARSFTSHFEDEAEKGIKDLGFEIASPDEVKEMIGLNKKKQ